MRHLLLPALLVAFAFPVTAQRAIAQPAADPPWVADVVGDYGGMVRNAGRMQCHHTSFELKDGHLIGHYRIEDDVPFNGELTDFVPDDDSSGTFTWHDRFGVGKEYVRFAPDHASFFGAWGDDTVDPRNPVRGTRGGVAGCAGAVS
ncbi:hypothetical protein [Acidisphaera sp. L21]|uniref:hypothetical protein n=1 Tax=Acidisphaera sp. L21 TaxID=1641851 RepID=UPI00131CB0A2|nr:hypothetical protein [Acidisphaera sp. L21]